ncbi:unnamed protein product [Phytophthora fragariaefolia]|uniref:Unnamed protein product n=1 Tax=Phytophthora fragariaefolia TaxID=1490495 RepID=A0A9W7DAV5_9STRA|nr:unnamed protein product [Phytophthora fragariaefolia]
MYTGGILGSRSLILCPTGYALSHTSRFHCFHFEQLHLSQMSKQRRLTSVELTLQIMDAEGVWQATAHHNMKNRLGLRLVPKLASRPDHAPKSVCDLADLTLSLACWLHPLKGHLPLHPRQHDLSTVSASRCHEPYHTTRP